MTEQKAIVLLNQEKVPMVLNGKNNEQLVVAHIKAIEALEKQKAIKATGYKIEETIARNIIAWETSKDKSQGLLPEVYLTDRELFRQLTGLEPNICNLKKYVN